ncbi:ABC transporter ATP-binding protein [Catenuloplanes japonicus]|uniref:ABC transporter ATP-binding protein n=1 Tax=Catenuloplanes japonicus TaxID=33876 RepID=UPI00068CB273|nr:ABC transporter ATP-binding protein [Catenuloplanes japonicus]
MSTRIRLTDVTKDYGLAVPAVDNVSLTIEPGEFMTLLGPSGSGKTTTLNLIAGFETLTAGTIAFDDADVSTLPPHKRNLGMLFQNYALFPHMTVAQNVAYPLRERKVPKPDITRRVAEVLDLVQLTGRDGHYPSQLSGGQQQRVALARAIVFGPAALLLDEPLGALDRNLRGVLQAEIHRIHQEVGTTFVFVTHDQEEAMNLSDRIALFNNGKIEQVGTPEALYQRPETLFTARFLGDSNVFPLDKPFDGKAVWEDSVWAVDPGTVAAPTASALVVRPEDMRLSTSSVPGTNSVGATVRAVEYMGAYRTVVLALGRSGLTGRARLGPEDTAIAAGQTVVASWPVARQRLVLS